MDNASNNASFMTHLARHLAEIGAVIRMMEKDMDNNDHPDTDTDPDTDSDESGEVTTRATRRAGPIRRARKTVTFIRKSGQRCDQLLDIIKEGNTDSLWTQVVVANNRAVSEPTVLAVVTVLPDVKTQWDSVFYMLRCLRYLKQPVIQFFTRNRDACLFRHPLENHHWSRLELMELILQQPHIVQTVMSSENTPILSGAIPAFELFMASWRAMVADPDLEAKEVKKFIQPGLDIANKYYNRFGDTNAYIIAMFINPSIRFEWIKQNWPEAELVQARKLVLEKLEEYEEDTSQDDASGSSSPTALAQATQRYRFTQKSLNFSAGN
ncbi:hypothetical protein MVEN_00127700 [Mycena venus]|uniref:hAT-like transposase RNase-H fold domain-containing protein n=1 Tax=Mycena venus TaxID=2733690 RepID=A0A8H6Z983_9AGAR|nr:hypothetical protein MVEN_00127700 [Mycena venus]